MSEVYEGKGHLYTTLQATIDIVTVNYCLGSSDWWRKKGL